MCALFGPEMSSKGDVLRSGTIGGQVLDRWTDDKIEEGCFFEQSRGTKATTLHLAVTGTGTGGTADVALSTWKINNSTRWA